MPASSHHFSGLSLEPAASTSQPSILGNDQVKATRLEEFRRFLHGQQQEWTNERIDLAFTGRKNEDTQFMLDALRGMEKGLETTQGQVSYAYPENDNFKVWDVPGAVGKDKTELEATFKRFDFVIVIASEITKKELETINILQGLKMNFALVYIDAENTEENGSKKLDLVGKVKKRLKKMKDKFKGGNESKEEAIEQIFSHVYVVRKNSWADKELQDLLVFVVQSLPPVKQESIVLGMPLRTEGLVEAKKLILKDRVWISSMISSTIQGSTGSVVSCDMELLIREISFFAQQFGLDPRSLDNLAIESGTSPRHLSRHTKEWILVLMGQVDEDTVTRLFQTLGSSGLKLAAGMGANIASPALDFVFPAMAFPVSFGTTFYMLNKLVDMLSIEALEVLDAAYKCSGVECGFVKSDPFSSQEKINSEEEGGKICDKEESKVSEDEVKVSEDEVKVSEDEVKVSEDEVKVSEDAVKVSKEEVGVKGVN